jgi:hypothetical protein
MTEIFKKELYDKLNEAMELGVVNSVYKVDSFNKNFPPHLIKDVMFGHLYEDIENLYQVFTNEEEANDCAEGLDSSIRIMRVIRIPRIEESSIEESRINDDMDEFLVNLDKWITIQIRQYKINAIITS